MILNCLFYFMFIYKIYNYTSYVSTSWMAYKQYTKIIKNIKPTYCKTIGVPKQHTPHTNRQVSWAPATHYPNAYEKSQVNKTFWEASWPDLRGRGVWKDKRAQVEDNLISPNHAKILLLSAFVSTADCTWTVEIKQIPPFPQHFAYYLRFSLYFRPSLEDPWKSWM